MAFPGLQEKGMKEKSTVTQELHFHPAVLLTLPWSFLSLSMFLLTQIFPCFGFMVQMQPSLAPLMGACMQMYLGVGLALLGGWSFLV